MAEKGDLRKRKEAKEKEYIKSLYKFIINNNIYNINNIYIYIYIYLIIHILINVVIYI